MLPVARLYFARPLAVRPAPLETDCFSPRPTESDTDFLATQAPIHDESISPRPENLRSILTLDSRLATGYAKVTAKASAASGEAKPLAFMSFLASRAMAPEELVLYCGLQRSDFSSRSFGIEAVRNHWRISPHISARLFCHIAGFDDFQPKLTPRTLYRCSFKRSKMP